MVGLANGIIVTRFRINALIGTLAMSFVVGGIGAIVTQGNLVVAVRPPGVPGSSPPRRSSGITSAAWMMIVIAIATAILLSRTTFGRYVYATGGNAEAARLGGVRDRHRSGSPRSRSAARPPPSPASSTRRGS